MPVGILAVALLGAALQAQVPDTATAVATVVAHDAAHDAAHDTVSLGRTIGAAREALGRMPEIWRIDADSVNWLFVGSYGAWVTELRCGRDWLVPFHVPAGTPHANMSVDIAGQRYAMVVLPLGGTSAERVRLLVHEATHTFQPHLLPRPGGTEAGKGGDFLDREQGRLWLFLELRALGRAISAADGESRRAAARDALLFRAMRDSLAHPAERDRLDSLDLVEGIPSYTAWRLTLAEPADLAARLDSAPRLAMSWVRGIPYETGPAYGYLLDALSGDAWRPAFRAGRRLPAILSTVLGSRPFTRDLGARARIYGYDAMNGAERARTVANARRLDSLRTLFVTGPVLRLMPGALSVTFDPNGQFPLGDAGTVMMNFRWASEDGAELVAVGGALVSPTWSWFQVPLSALRLESSTLAESRQLAGAGWTLTLPPNWRVVRVGANVEVRPPR